MVNMNNLTVNVSSEIGELEAVIIHTPGSEIENMTPENAERALYSDILNLAVAKEEYTQFHEVLKKVANVFEVEDLLASILQNDKVKNDLINKICTSCIDPHLTEFLFQLDNKLAARHLIQGVSLTKDSLSRFLSPQRFALKPLHNFFFTRDASISMYDKVLISKMASKVRERESQIMEAIFDYYPAFNTSTFNAGNSDDNCEKISIEGGDVLIARNDIILIGIGARTSPEGVDVVIEKLKGRKETQHIIVQELPVDRESFIHLDMVFTFLDKNECMVFEPVIMQPNRYKTIHITINNKKVTINEEKNILESLSKLGMELKPIYCGGTFDPWIQEREQWHSGANFFAMGPGKIIGYGRNVYTMEELNKNGYEIVSAKNVIKGKVNLAELDKYVVTIEGSELSRGGGGARCMTMPVVRKEVNWK
jgi:arginine deiminase